MYSKGKKSTIRFAIKPTSSAKEVLVAGDFNDWRPVAMQKQNDGIFSLNVPCVRDSFQYKFIVDGQWVRDPDHSNWAANPFGTMNSIGFLGSKSPVSGATSRGT